jgi:hypothetical protein
MLETSSPRLGRIADSQQTCEQQLRNTLGDTAFEAGFAEGLGFTVAQAFGCALGGYRRAQIAGWIREQSKPNDTGCSETPRRE